VDTVLGRNMKTPEEINVVLRQIHCEFSLA